MNRSQSLLFIIKNQVVRSVAHNLILFSLSVIFLFFSPLLNKNVMMDLIGITCQAILIRSPVVVFQEK